MQQKPLEPARQLIDPLLFVGEAPGESEDAGLQPFIGKSGRFFRSILSPLLQENRWYVVNALVCTPYNADLEITTPTLIETLRCSHNLEAIITAINPKRIISLGKVADKLLTHFNIVHDHLEHPAHILRSGGVETPTGKRFQLKLQAIVKKYA